MNANELRIGNLINQIDVGGFHPVLIDIKNLESLSNGDVRYEPISVTESWLLTLGFQLAEGLSILGKEKLTIPLNERLALYYQNKQFTIVGTKQEQPIVLDRIEYIHKLQNFYFGITGKELTI